MIHNYSSKIATPDDSEKVKYLVKQTVRAAPKGIYTEEKYLAIVDHVLNDMDYGFFVIATNIHNQRGVGLMYFTQEFSDWRNGLFFWLQSSYYGDDQEVHNNMLAFMDQYQKDNSGVGYRFVSKKIHTDFWASRIKQMKMCDSGYHVYQVDATADKKSFPVQARL